MLNHDPFLPLSSFGLDDFAEVKNDLLGYRKAYIESNMSFDVKII
jgi:hypothetical protein